MNSNVINLTLSPSVSTNTNRTITLDSKGKGKRRRDTSTNSNATTPARRRPRVNNNAGAGPSRPRPGPRRGPGSRPGVNVRPHRHADVFPPSRSRSRSPAANNNNGTNLRTRFGVFQLQPHQVAVSRLFVKPGVPGLLLYFKVGSGKTLAAIAAVENLARRDRTRRGVLVVLPASLRSNFVKELRAAGVDASRYTVVSFHALHLMTREARLALGRNKVLVVDEVQGLRNPLSKMLDSLLQVAEVSHKRLLLSGTPVMNYPSDIGPVLGLINPANVPLTVKTTEIIYNNNGQGVEKQTPAFANSFGKDASSNRAVLDAMLRCTSLYYEPNQETVRREYPTKTEHIVEVMMTTQQTEKQYEMAAKEALLGERPGRNYDDSESVFFLTKVREFNSSYGGRHPKIDELVQRVAEEVLFEGGRCVVYSQYVEKGLRVIASKLQQLGVTHLLYMGGVSEAEKKQFIERYNAGGIQVLLLSDAGKEGLDLKNTTQVHILEPAWNEDKIQQVIGRAVRYKSHETAPKKHVDVFRYIATINPDAKKPSKQTSGEWLHKYSADQLLAEVAANKAVINTLFLQRLIAISDENLRTC